MGRGSSSVVSAGDVDSSSWLSGVTAPPDREHSVCSSYRGRQECMDRDKGLERIRDTHKFKKGSRCLAQISLMKTLDIFFLSQATQL